MKLTFALLLALSFFVLLSNSLAIQESGEGISSRSQIQSGVPPIKSEETAADDTESILVEFENFPSSSPGPSSPPPAPPIEIDLSVNASSITMQPNLTSLDHFALENCTANIQSWHLDTLLWSKFGYYIVKFNGTDTPLLVKKKIFFQSIFPFR